MVQLQQEVRHGVPQEEGRRVSILLRRTGQPAFLPIEERYVYTYCTDNSDADANYTNRKQESEFEHFICRPFVKVAEEDDIHNKNYEAKRERNFAAQRDSIASKFFIALVHKPFFFIALAHT